MLIPLYHGYHGFDLKFTGHSLVVFFISQHKKIKNKIGFFLIKKKIKTFFEKKNLKKI